ncbi:MAG: hypothetical protein AAF845_02660 [Bacteroidota bacterium]
MRLVFAACLALGLLGAEAIAQTTYGPIPLQRFAQGVSLGSPAEWGSLEVAVTTPTRTFTVPDVLLGGHAWHAARVRYSVDHAQGHIGDPAGGLRRLCQMGGGRRDGGGCQVTVTYRPGYTAPPIRTEAGVNVIRLEEWGLGTATDDAGAVLNRALNALRETPGCDRIEIPAGTFTYNQPTILHGCLEIRGAGAVATEATPVDGVARVVPQPQGRTTFRLADNRVASRDPVLAALRLSNIAWSAQEHAAGSDTRITITDVHLDGNTEGNLAAYRAANEGRFFQDGPTWTGISTSNHHGLARCPEAVATRLTLRRVHIEGFGATGVLSAGTCDTATLETARIEDAIHNHLLYDVGGTWDRVTLAGAAWSHVVVNRDVEASEVVIETTSNVVNRNSPNVFGVRSGHLAIDGFYADTRPAHHRVLFDAKRRGSVTLRGGLWRADAASGLFSGGRESLVARDVGIEAQVTAYPIVSNLRARTVRLDGVTVREGRPEEGHDRTAIVSVRSSPEGGATLSVTDSDLPGVRLVAVDHSRGRARLTAAIDRASASGLAYRHLTHRGSDRNVSGFRFCLPAPTYADASPADCEGIQR